MLSSGRGSRVAGVSCMDDSEVKIEKRLHIWLDDLQKNAEYDGN